jgi:hypothetical protein
MENEGRYSMNEPTHDSDQPPAMSAFKAVLIGQVLVNLPLLVIVLAAFILSGIYFPEQPLVGLIAALVLGWGWWHLATRRWRAWALSKGIPPRDLTRMASFTGLASPRDYYNQELEDDEDDDDSYPRRL